MTTNTKLNARQHRFALNLVQGMSQTDAYLNAGYNVPREVAASNAAQLIRNPRVSTFYDSLRTAAVTELQDAVLSDSEKRSILAKIARAELTDFLDGSGRPSLTKKTPNAKAAKEFYHKTQLDKDGNPIVTSSIKLVDAIEAIREDNKMMGSYAPSKHLIGQKVHVEIAFVDRKRLTEGED